MEKIAVFPGSFDPFTKGHKSIVTRAIPLFDKVIIAIGHNPKKRAISVLKKDLAGLKQFLMMMTKYLLLTSKALR